MKQWIEAIRPKTLTASAGPVLLGVAAAFWYSQGQIYISTAVITLLCALFMQIGTNLVNDYFDYKTGIDNEKRLGPKRASASGAIDPKNIQRGYQFTFLMALALGIYLIYLSGTVIAIIGGASLLFAYIYTAGPYPLSHHGLGEVFAYLFFGPIAVLGTYYIQSGYILWSDLFNLFLIGSVPGLVAATLMAVNNIRDYASDKAANKKTLVVNIGLEQGRKLAIGFIGATMLLLCILAFTFKASLALALIIPFLFIKTWKGILFDEITSDFNNHLANTGKFLFIYSIFISICILL